MYGNYLIILLISVVVIFFVGREVACWYFKINESLNVLKEIRDLLKGSNPQTEEKLDETEEKLDANKIKKIYGGISDAEIYELLKEGTGWTKVNRHNVRSLISLAEADGNEKIVRELDDTIWT